MVFGALQNESAAHVGRRVVEVKDNIVGVWASFGAKYPVDLLGSLHLVGQVISSRGTAGQHIHSLSDNHAEGTMSYEAR